jgi:hypothetical protein
VIILRLDIYETLIALQAALFSSGIIPQGEKYDISYRIPAIMSGSEACGWRTDAAG